MYIDDYFKMLTKEIENSPTHEVRTIYIGGGTPSTVPIKLIETLLNQLMTKHSVVQEAEITIEVNPASMTLDKARAYHRMGINRVSIGLQAVQRRLLETLGRIHDADKFVQTMEYLDSAGFDNCSADLMYGLPGQSCSDLMESIAFATGFEQIVHLSGYSLIIEEETPFAALYNTGKLHLPDENTERKMDRLLKNELQKRGFEKYEISSFAKPGFESKHNLAYWDLTPYLGYGLGAASFYDGCRYTNTRDINAYLGNWSDHPPRQEAHCLDKPELMGDYMMLGLRKTKGVSLQLFKERFGCDLRAVYRNEMKPLIDNGLVTLENGYLHLTSKGEDLGNQVFMTFV